MARMGSTSIDTSADILDTRDIEARIDYLESDRDDYVHTCIHCREVITRDDDAEGADPWLVADGSVVCASYIGEEPHAPHEPATDWAMDNEDDASELATLTALRDECGSHEWRDGVMLIRDSYFETYAQEFAEDIHGNALRNASWPFDYINWTAASEALKMDYSSAGLDGETYWYLD